MNTTIPANHAALAAAGTDAATRARGTAWTRLAAAARSAIIYDPRDATAPHGFATRVVARALGPQRAAAAPMLVHYAMRAFGLACLLTILLVSINLGSILSDIDDEAATLGDTPIEAADLEPGPAADAAVAGQ